jgi:hypothetical protein
MNLAELTTSIEDYTENRNATFVANIPTFIRNAERRIHIDCPDLPRSRLMSFAAMTPTVRVYPTPVRLLTPLSLSVSSPAGVFIDYLDNKEPEYVYSAFGNSAQARPRVYALLDNNEFVVSPAPDLAYRMDFAYTGYPESIVESGTSWIGDNFEFVLLYGALVEAYTFMKGEADVLQGYALQYKDSLRLLKDFSQARSHQDAFRVAQGR